MNEKNIKKHLNQKMNDWLSSIDDDKIKDIIRKNVIITGGAIVSLLTGEEVNDYDVYFRTREACLEVANYYVNKWNYKHKGNVSIKVCEETGKFQCYVASAGIADENDNGVGYVIIGENNNQQNKNSEKDKYRPTFITSNAITLSDKIQVVIRFYGEVEDIHKNFDFVHCTCVWSSWDNELVLPSKALECIINKELHYVGSKYPLCSIIRTKKYLERGYHINAGQYVKMCMQLNELDLNKIDVLEDQLTGVDTAYFAHLIDAVRKHSDEKTEDKDTVDTLYIIEVIDRLF